MTDRTTNGKAFGRRLVVEAAGDVSSRLLARAREQHRDGVKHGRGVVRSGLRELDTLVPNWFGLTILSGPPRVGKTALASRVALETARRGGRSLWLATDGMSETPVFRLLTGLARVPARNLFVDRRLEDAEWRALDAAAVEIGTLPIAVVDLHGATLEELVRVTWAAQREGALELVIVDGIRKAEGQSLLGLEALAEELDVPVLAIFAESTPPDASAIALGVGALAHAKECVPCSVLRPGSLVIHLEEGTPSAHRPALDARPLRLAAHRCGNAAPDQVGLRILRACRWIESAMCEEPTAHCK